MAKGGALRQWLRRLLAARLDGIGLDASGGEHVACGEPRSLLLKGIALVLARVGNRLVNQLGGLGGARHGDIVADLRRS